jgi:hypothetical protein
MSDTTLSAELGTATAPVLPISDILPCAVFIVFVAMALLYLVGAEAGATSIFPGMTVHEWMHDGRHLLGFPCH